MFGHVDPAAHGYFGNGFVNVFCDDCLVPCLVTLTQRPTGTLATDLSMCFVMTVYGSLFGHVDPKAHGYFGTGFVNVLCDDGLRLLFGLVDPQAHGYFGNASVNHDSATARHWSCGPDDARVQGYSDQFHVSSLLHMIA